MDTLRLDAAVGLLTRDSKHRVALPEGGARWVTAAPLLVQLRMAITNSTASATFASSSGNPLPIAAAAHDLLQEINTSVNDHWWQTYRLHNGLGRGKVASELRAWAAVARVDEALARTCQLLCEGWCASITGLLQPARHWEIDGACPKCKAARVATCNEDGETVRVRALVITFAADGTNWGECRGCGERFVSEVLARAIAFPAAGA